MLARRPGPVVTNLSTSLVVDDAAAAYGQAVDRAPVGEANVVERMTEREAVVGGEGNGGVILPEVHLGRDAPVAAALTLALCRNIATSMPLIQLSLNDGILPALTSDA